MVETPPTVGRVVHYVLFEGMCLAAIVTEVGVDVPGGLDVAEPEGVLSFVGLCVISPTGVSFPRAVPYDAQKTLGTWHWPERV